MATVLDQILSGTPTASLLEGADLQECAKVFVFLRDELEQLSSVKAKIQSAYDYVRLNKIPEMMDEMGAKSVNLDGIGRVTLTGDAYVSVPADRRGELQEWLVENGFSDLITETVNSSTLKAWTLRRVKAGEDVPEAIKFTPFSRASVTKA